MINIGVHEEFIIFLRAFKLKQVMKTHFHAARYSSPRIRTSNGIPHSGECGVKRPDREARAALANKPTLRFFQRCFREIPSPQNRMLQLICRCKISSAFP